MNPLEDNAGDIIGKAQRGLGISDSELATKTGVSAEIIRKLRYGHFDESVLAGAAPVLGLDARALVEIAQSKWRPDKTESLDGLAQDALRQISEIVRQITVEAADHRAMREVAVT